MAERIAAWFLGGVSAAVLLTWAASWCHVWLHRTASENWWFLYTIPAGVMFGGALVNHLLNWTLWLEEAERLPRNSRLAWVSLAAVLFLSALALVLALILGIGHSVSPGEGYPILLVTWVFFLWLGRAPRRLDPA